MHNTKIIFYFYQQYNYIFIIKLCTIYIYENVPFFSFPRYSLQNLISTTTLMLLMEMIWVDNFS